MATKMDTTEAFARFREIYALIHAYQHASSVLYFDSVTAAPPDTAKGRGETLAVLSAASYELETGEEMTNIVEQLYAAKDELDVHKKREIEEFWLAKEYISSIPKEEYVEFTRLINDAQNVWHKAKSANDFASFAPYLERIFDTTRRFCGYYKPNMDPYDVCLDMYERGLTRERADAFFQALREKIVPLIQRIGKTHQVNTSFLDAVYPIDKQRAFADYLMQVMCIDRAHCNIGETEHPFTIEFNKEDVRITTHYYEHNMASSMFSVIHEGGHALYELNIGDEYANTCLGGGVSMGIHESQSRLFENIIGRSEQFVSLIFPKLQELFPTQFDGVTAHDFYLAINKSEPSLIRIEADELTYALHVMIRYEIEKAVMSGELSVIDIPNVWNEKYREYLGVDVPDDTHGVLQDSHWSGGSIGYFPSYALGSAYGAQIMAKMREDLDVESAIASGSLREIVDWLTEHIFRHGGMYNPADLLERCVGAPFDPKYFTDYLEEKYLGIYGF
jgi:carboxypeptidase Taq